MKRKWKRGGKIEKPSLDPAWKGKKRESKKKEEDEVVRQSYDEWLGKKKSKENQRTKQKEEVW